MIWGGWINPAGGTIQAQDAAIAVIHRVEHSPACKLIGGNEGTILWDFSLIDQDYIMDCKHRSHASVHFLFKTWCDETYELTKPEEGKLF